MTTLRTALFYDTNHSRWSGIDWETPPEDDPRTTYDGPDSDFEEDEVDHDDESELTPLEDDSQVDEPVTKRSRLARDSRSNTTEKPEDAAAETLCDAISVKQERCDPLQSHDGRHAENTSTGMSKRSVLPSVPFWLIQHVLQQRKATRMKSKIIS